VPVFVRDCVAAGNGANRPARAARFDTRRGRTQLTNETPQLWFVELASPPTADGGNPATLASERAAFVGEARNARLNYSVRYTYQSLFHGFSVRIAPSDLGRLSRIPGVQRIYPEGNVA